MLNTSLNYIEIVAFACVIKILTLFQIMSWSHEKICQALPAYSHSSVGEPGNEAIDQAYAYSLLCCYLQRVQGVLHASRGLQAPVPKICLLPVTVKVGLSAEFASSLPETI